MDMSKKKKTEIKISDTESSGLGFERTVQGIGSLGKGIGLFSGATMEDYLKGSVEFKSLQGLKMPDLKLDPHFPINISTPERKDDIIFYNTENVEELESTLKNLFKDLGDDPDKPSNKSYKVLAKKLGIHWKTLLKFNEPNNSDDGYDKPVSKKVLDRLIQKFKNIYLSKIENTSQLIHFINDNDLSGLILDFSYPKDVPIKSFKKPIQETYQGLVSILISFWNERPNKKFAQLDHIEKYQENDWLNNIFEKGVHIFVGTVPSFMSIPEKHEYSDTYNNNLTKVIYFLIGNNESNVDRIKYMPDWDQLIQINSKWNSD